MSRPPLSRLIHAADPYEGFDHTPYALDAQGWGEGQEMFHHAILQHRPRTIVEVGTWKGSSALLMATLLKNLDIEGEIVCVDTFLGSAEHWSSPEYYGMLAHRNGYPTLYYQFLANVCHAGFQEVITPFPITSENAAQFFLAKGVTFDLVYIDAGHSYEEVMRDLKLYWRLVNPGGALIGDDFAVTWPGVVRAVAEFADIIDRPMRHFKGKFIFTK